MTAWRSRLILTLTTILCCCVIAACEWLLASARAEMERQGLDAAGRELLASLSDLHDDAPDEAWEDPDALLCHWDPHGRFGWGSAFWLVEIRSGRPYFLIEPSEGTPDHWAATLTGAGWLSAAPPATSAAPQPTNDPAGTRFGLVQVGSEWLCVAVLAPHPQRRHVVALARPAKEAMLNAPLWRLRIAGGSAIALVVLLGGLVCLGVVSNFNRAADQLNNDLERQVRHRTAELVRTRDAVIFGLAKLAEFRDDDTGAHLERVRGYVEVLARRLRDAHPTITESYVSMLGLTSSLHDIGKVGIPDAILLKPGKLSPAERTIIQRHTLIGGDCLVAIGQRLGPDPFIEIATEIAFSHHERWDGGGYPFGLKREQIPLSARIVALADTYDALTTRRCYKSAYTHEDARAIIVAEEGRQFDPQVVAAFIAGEDDFRAICSTNSVAEVGVLQRYAAAIEEAARSAAAPRALP